MTDPCRRENGGNCDIKNLTKGCKVYFPGEGCWHPLTWRRSTERKLSGTGSMED